MRVKTLDFRSITDATRWKLVDDSRMHAWLDEVTGRIYQKDMQTGNQYYLCSIEDFDEFVPMGLTTSDIGYYLNKKNNYGHYRLEDAEYDALWAKYYESKPHQTTFTVAQLKEILEVFPDDSEVSLDGVARLKDGTKCAIRVGAKSVKYGDSAKVVLIAGEE